MALPKSIAMSSIPATLADRNRTAAAVNLAARHLTDRPAKHITRRNIDDMWVWRVESQTDASEVYTVTLIADGWPVDSCSCPDCAYRHLECKHLKAVKLLATPPAEWAPRGGWLSDQPRKRTEYQEEV